MGEFIGVWRQVEMPSAPVVIRKPVNEGECPALSLVIAVHNQWQYTERCLETLFADMPQVEVVVVDNGSTDETPQRLAAYGGVRHIRLEQNIGVGPAWNLGLAACDSPVVGVLNNDVVIHEGGMRALADAAWRTGIAAHVGGTLDEQCNFRGFTANGWDADYADGAALLFRRDVMEEVGLFDEAFEPAYSEDADWSLRARLKGWEFALCPTALEHVGQATAKQFKDLRERMEKNRTLLSARYSRLGVGQRVAVHRHGALGDVIMVTPAIRAMKMALPLARVWLECAPIIADAMQGIRCVDGVSPKAPFTVTRQVELDRAYEDLDHAGVWPHPVRQYGEILGYGMGLGRMEVPEDPQAAEWADRILAHVSLPIVACVLRSAHRPKANWSEREWLRLAQLMPHRVMVAIDPEPRPQLEPFGVYRGARFFDEPNVIDLTGKTPSVRAVFEVIRKAAVCVSVDTGPMHAAAAMDIPLVAICGGSPGWSRVPFSGKVRVLQGKAPCYPCVCPSQCEERPQTGHCLSVIEARDVAFAVDDLTGRRMLVKEGVGRLRVER